VRTGPQNFSKDTSASDAQVRVQIEDFAMAKAQKLLVLIRHDSGLPWQLYPLARLSLGGQCRVPLSKACAVKHLSVVNILKMWESVSQAPLPDM
jgi:hypothetical protein